MHSNTDLNTPQFYMKSSKPLPNRLIHEAKIIKTRLDEYFFVTPEPIAMKTDNQSIKKEGDIKKGIAIDPGIVTFATGYDWNGVIHEWGREDRKRIIRLLLAADKLCSILSSKTEKHRKRYQVIKAFLRIKEKIQN